MNPEIKEILEDLYHLDPSLRAREKEVGALVEKLLASKPQVEMSEEFLSSLRQEVLLRFEARADEEAEPAEAPAAAPAWRGWMAFAAGFAVMALVIVVVMPLTKDRVQNTEEASLPTSGQTALGLGTPSGPDFIDVGGRAFGALGLSSGWNEASPSALATDEDVVANAAYQEEAGSGRGGSGVSGSSGSVPAAAPPLISEKMVPYEPVSFEFKYAGEPLELTDSSVEVFKRVKHVGTGDLSGVVAALDLGLFDPQTLSDVQVNNIGLSEDHDFGYDLQISLSEGMAYLNQNYPRWQIGPGCADGICSDQPALTPADMPGNEEIVALTDSFIAGMGISQEGYGAPQVDDSWRNMPPPAPDQPVYVPDYIQVKYPLMIKDRAVYGGPGYQVGLDVTVDVRRQKVSNLGPIQSRRYETSSYPAETDAARVIAAAEKGGFGGGWYFSEAGNKVTLELDTPRLVYLQQYVYGGAVGSELYVPALLFPVKDWQEKGFWSDSVAVPLAKEMLDQLDQNFPGPQPMPLIEPAPAEQVK